MIKKDVAGYVSVVREFLDEVNTNDAEFLDGSDDESLTAIIKSKIIDAANYVNLNADFTLIKPDRTEVYKKPEPDGVIIYEMEPKILRLVSVYVQGWSRAVTEFIPSTSDGYAALKNPITTGYPDNPKVAIGYHQPAGERTPEKYLELYRCEDIEHAVYFWIEYVRRHNSGDESIYVPETLERAVACYAAGLTLRTFKDSHADVLINMANSMIEEANTKSMNYGNNI